MGGLFRAETVKLVNKPVIHIIRLKGDGSKFAVLNEEHNDYD
jgi:hypothetical protein